MNERIKIAQITSDDIALRYLLLNQLRDLHESGSYEVVAISSWGAEVPTIESVGIRHIAVAMTRRPVTPLRDLVTLIHLVRILRREKFDVVHTHTTKAGFLGRWAAMLARVPVIVHTNHGFVFHEASRRVWRTWFIWLERLAAACSDLIFCVSSEDVSTARQLRIGSDRTVLLGAGGMGIDTRLFRRERFTAEGNRQKLAEVGVRDPGPIVGFVGRLTKEKGVLDLFHAGKLVHAAIPDVGFLMIGFVDIARSDPVPYKAALDEGVGDYFHFLGLRPDIPDLLAVMDIFVLPSHREGFPRVLMEAAAMGLPIVTTTVRGSREVIDHGRTGLLVPPRDPQRLASAILELLADQRRAAQMGAAASLEAAARFDERPVFQKIRSEYERLLTSSVSRRAR